MRPFLFCLVCCMLAICSIYPHSNYAADNIWATGDAVASVGVWSSASVSASCNSATCKAPEFSSQQRICANSRVSGRGYLRSMCGPAKRVARPLARLIRIRR